MTCAALQGTIETGPIVIFVDCSGAFRPERIAEISDSRGLETKKILERILSISVRSVSDQRNVSRKIAEDHKFSNSRLLIIDDVTGNFMTEYGRRGEVAERQTVLSAYLRQLSFLCNTGGISALLTNSARSRGDEGEGETTGEVLSAFVLSRIYFKKVNRDRFAELEQLSRRKLKVRFVIEKSGMP